MALATATPSQRNRPSSPTATLQPNGIRHWAGGALLLLLCLNGCSTGEKPPVRPSGIATRPPEAATATPAIPASRYFAEVTAIDLFEIRAADIALQRGSGRARSFALESKRQHQAISAQMSFAGRYLDLLPSPVLPAQYQQMLTALLATGNFNALYLDQQRTVVDRALKLHTGYARTGESPTLRPVARFAAQAVASELRFLGR